MEPLPNDDDISGVCHLLLLVTMLVLIILCIKMIINLHSFVYAFHIDEIAL